MKQGENETWRLSLACCTINVVAMPFVPNSFLFLVASLPLVAMPGAPSRFLLLVVRPGAPSVLAPNVWCLWMPGIRGLIISARGCFGQLLVSGGTRFHPSTVPGTRVCPHNKVTCSSKLFSALRVDATSISTYATTPVVFSMVSIGPQKGLGPRPRQHRLLGGTLPAPNPTKPITSPLRSLSHQR